MMQHKKKKRYNDIFIDIPLLEIVDKHSDIKVKEILKHPSYKTLSDLDDKYTLGIFDELKNGRKRRRPAI